MERDIVYFGLVAVGAFVLWALFRRGTPTRGRMSMIASAIAVGIAYFILFRMLE